MLRILRWGDYSALFRWALNFIRRVPVKGRQRDIQHVRGDVTTGEGKRDHKPRNASSFQKKEEMGLSGASRRKQPCPLLDISPMKLT